MARTRHTYRIIRGDGSEHNVTADSAAQVRRVYPDTRTITRTDTEPARTTTTRWDPNGSSDPWAGGVLAARLRAAQDRF